MRPIPESERRFEGNTWYCSHSCFLTAESASASSLRKPPTPRRKWRRRIVWTVGILVGLIAGLAVLGAVVGTSTTKTAKKSAVSRVAVRHGLVSPAHPVPIGKYAAIGHGWRMKVVSVLRNVSQARLGRGHEPLPKGAENVVVKITVNWVRGGSGNSQQVVNQMNAIGAHAARYHADGVCLGNAEFGDGGVLVYSGQTQTGTACFRIAKNDDKTLRLYVNRGSYFETRPSTSSVWFALRRQLWGRATEHRRS